MKTKIRFLSIIMTAALLLTSLVLTIPVTADEEEQPTKWSENAGSWDTAAEPLVIANATEFAAFAKAIVGGNTFDGKTITLAASIDLSAHDWDSGVVGGQTTSKSFKGVFDGNGFAITGVKLSAGETYSAGAGLFGYVAGTIKNLELSITVPNVTATNGYVGGLCSYLNAGTIDSCKIHVNIDYTVSAQKDTYIGGVAGIAVGGSIVNTTVDGTASGQVVVNNILGIGGFTGTNNSKVTTMENDVSKVVVSVSRVEKSTSKLYAGGMIANVVKGVTITNCANFGALTVTVPEEKDTDEIGVGGLFGLVKNTTTVTTCFNNGELIAPVSNGLIGLNTSTNNVKVITSMSMYGDVVAKANPSKLAAFTNDASVTLFEILPETMEGAAVRLRDDTADSGLRFNSRISANAYKALKALKTAGFLDYELGTIITSTENMNAVDNGQYDEIEKKIDVKYDKECADGGDGYVYFNGAVKAIKKAHFELAYSADAYLKLTVGNEISTVFANYSANDVDRSRTVVGVATLAYNDRAESADEVYQYEVETGSFSPYTKAQLTILGAYLGLDE